MDNLLLQGYGLFLQGYTVPSGLVPSDVSSANQIAVFTQVVTNPAVLTIILLAVAAPIVAGVMKMIRSAKRA